ncbi:flavin monoamine oxidase family protein [Sulfitobacter aestuariivivens]|uniref:FAD-dependent oxidoreductase n=1 Tax=Sulfitobacter aestuariivivens TaxID=2766981 RepID=A0A927HG00_9RHOB|nr:NAD(P)/FAD-dependent oxidoreductase [Sulfitobacter aestuariivivens]MBD3664959.1 FAD-dependent oxidoreductase [Sulfitobacter aestuariivivens]
METDVAIVGGGLAGLALAEVLDRRDISYQLFEARDRFGGRIKTETVGHTVFDMGPAWFWPGQPRMAQMVARFDLKVFDQHAEGMLSFEDESGQVQRGRSYASMEGSLRLAGGMTELVDALVSTLPPARLHRRAAVTSIAQIANGVSLSLKTGRSVTAKAVALALPPRLIADQITFAPTLDAPAHEAMCAVPTWMAGQAKAVAVYPSPFWRDAGLSGDAMSQRGPMVEVHDASPIDGSMGALFGFIGIAPQHRQDETALRTAVTRQLERLFGEAAARPAMLSIKDWARDTYTASLLDQQPLSAHPAYGLPQPLDGLWDGRLVFAGTEVAPQFGGYLEGALEAAENATARLL